MTFLKSLSNELGINKRIKFLGYLEKEQLVDVIYNSIAYISFSSFEGNSNSLDEAILTGLNLILSDITSHRESAYDFSTIIDISLPLNNISMIVRQSLDNFKSGKSKSYLHKIKSLKRSSSKQQLSRNLSLLFR